MVLQPESGLLSHLGISIPRVAETKAQQKEFMAAVFPPSSDEQRRQAKEDSERIAQHAQEILSWSIGGSTARRGINATTEVEDTEDRKPQDEHAPRTSNASRPNQGRNQPANQDDDAADFASSILVASRLSGAQMQSAQQMLQFAIPAMGAMSGDMQGFLPDGFNLGAMGQFFNNWE